MKTLTSTLYVRHSHLAFLHDSRFWAIAALIAFMIVFTVFLVWAAQQQGPASNTPLQNYPYWPYGPFPVPVR